MKLLINGKTYEVPAGAAQRSLLTVLRDELGLMGTRYGCGMGLCRACTVHVDGTAVPSCQTPVAAIEGKQITTIEGLAPTPQELHPVQRAFIELQVPQCGFCMSGQIMTAAAFLRKNPRPSAAQVAEAMAPNLCRCGTYPRIVKAVLRAAGRVS